MNNFDNQLCIGRSLGEENGQSKPILLEANKAGVTLVIGNRGYGKTYTENVILEEYLKIGTRQAILVLDSMGIYYSLKEPNTDRELLENWNSSSDRPEAIASAAFDQDVRIIVPLGDAHHYPLGSYDSTLALNVSALSAAVWIDCFGLDAVSPQAAIFYALIDEIKEEKPESATIVDLLEICRRFQEQDSFHPASIRAVISKLEAALRWGIFSKDGFESKDSLASLFQQGKVTVLDLTFSDTYVRRIIAAFILREVLDQRIKQARSKNALHELIPPCHIVLEEAHEYMSKGGKSLAAGRDYIRKGRSPGCSITLVTQQAEDLDTTSLKQPDVVVCHRTTHKDAIAVIKKICSGLPKNFLNAVRRLPPGECYVVHHRSNSAIKGLIRPRHSAHVARTEIESDPGRKEILPSTKTSFELAQNYEQKAREYFGKYMEAHRVIVAMQERTRQLENELTKAQQKIQQLQETQSVSETSTPSEELIDVSGSPSVQTYEDLPEWIQNHLYRLKSTLEPYPSLHMKILALLLETGNEYSTSQLAFRLNLSYNTLKSKTPVKLMKFGLLKRRRQADGWHWKANLKAFVRKEFAAFNKEVTPELLDLIQDHLKTWLILRGKGKL
jgi:DNA helicase HerA-like ATPase